MDVLEAEEIDDEDIGIEEDIIKSELIGKPLFCMHLDANTCWKISSKDKTTASYHWRFYLSEAI